MNIRRNPLLQFLSMIRLFWFRFTPGCEDNITDQFTPLQRERIDLNCGPYCWRLGKYCLSEIQG